MNAAVEGTEFMVESSCKATALTVIEGNVRSEVVATRDSQSVGAGQRVETGTISAGVISTVVKPQDAVQWVLRYAPLGDAPGALHAEELLLAGSVDDALAAIDAALAVDSASSDALALRAVIQIAKNDNAGAYDSALLATRANDENYRAWLALSYAQQAAFNLQAALDSAHKAQSLQPGSSLAHSRVAELYLSLGDARRAEAAARTAIEKNPAESHGYSVLGFVQLARIETKAARTSFEAAIERDSFSALPRLGLGLAIVRDGEFVKGREQLEIAVALDPSNSLLRSYVGKAYYEENRTERDQLAEVQFGLARALDENDPTPSFYQAILRLSQNQPVQALVDLHDSIEKNDNRAVYRSRFQLDDDVAARMASIAALYVELGFEKLAIFESTKAIAESAGNYSAHNLLATAYANLPRHDIARVSEVLQSQIRQPVSIASASPLLSMDNLAILRNTGPSQIGSNEFNELFNRNGVRLDFDGVIGDEGTLGNQLQISALEGTWSGTLGQLHYETDGFAENEAAEKDIYELFVQKQVSWKSSIQVDLKRTDFSIQETFFRFDPDNPLPVTIGEDADSYRISGHHETSAGSDWIWSAIYEDRYRLVEFSPVNFPITDTDAEAYAGEIQHLKALGQFNTVAGIGYVEDQSDFLIEGMSARSRAWNAYLYGQWKSHDDRLAIDLGVAGDWYRQTNSLLPTTVSRERLSPKFALTWTLRPGSTLRLAALSAVRRPFVASQTIEPTQLAGFNQYFSGFEQLYGDLEGTISNRAGIAFDQVMSPSLFAGLEIAKRELDVPAIGLDRDFTWRESTGFAYLYKTFSALGSKGALAQWSAVATMEAEYEKIERPQIFTGSEGIMDLETVRTPIGLRFFNANGLTLRLGATYIEQSGTFSSDVGQPVFDKEDSAWVTDAAIDYELPRRRGVITLGVMNMGDQFIDLVESDVFNPRVATRRFAFFKIKLTY